MISLKRSEYNQLVLAIVEKAESELNNGVKEAYKTGGQNSALAYLSTSIPDTVAHMVSDILKQSGVLHLEDDAFPDSE